MSTNFTSWLGGFAAGSTKIWRLYGTVGSFFIQKGAGNSLYFSWTQRRNKVLSRKSWVAFSWTLQMIPAYCSSLPPVESTLRSGRTPMKTSPTGRSDLKWRRSGPMSFRPLTCPHASAKWVLHLGRQDLDWSHHQHLVQVTSNQSQKCNLLAKQRSRLESRSLRIAIARQRH